MGKIKVKKIGKFADKWKYIITLLAFAIIIVFLDENNLIKRFNYAQQINEMQDDIRKNKTEFRINTIKLHLLQTNPHYIEKLAREKYLMKKADEDIFVIETE